MTDFFNTGWYGINSFDTKYSLFNKKVWINCTTKTPRSTNEHLNTIYWSIEQTYKKRIRLVVKDCMNWQQESQQLSAIHMDTGILETLQHLQEKCHQELYTTVKDKSRNHFKAQCSVPTNLLQKPQPNHKEWLLIFQVWSNPKSPTLHILKGVSCILRMAHLKNASKNCSSKTFLKSLLHNLLKSTIWGN